MLPVMAAVAVRKKVVSVVHFSPSFCLQSLQLFYLLDQIESNCIYWLHWKSEKNRTEPNELDELRYSKSLKQPAMLTDMLSCICMFKSKHLSVLKSEKKSKLNELNELECPKTPSQMSNSAHWHAFLYLHAQTCIKTFIHLSHFKSEKQTELNELDELEY